MNFVGFSNRRILSVLLALTSAFLIMLPLGAEEQGFSAEVNLGVSLFTFSDPALKARTSGGTLKIDLTYKPGFVFGAYGGYGLGNIELGGEVCFQTGSGTSGAVYVDNTLVSPDPGNYTFSMYRIAPVLRYFFSIDNEAILPFAAVSVGYSGTTIEVKDPAMKFTQGYVDIGFMGGAKYYVNNEVYVGGNLRLDVYTTVIKDDVNDATLGLIEDITTNGWIPLSLGLFAGYSF